MSKMNKTVEEKEEEEEEEMTKEREGFAEIKIKDKIIIKSRP